MNEGLRNRSDDQTAQTVELFTDALKGMSLSPLTLEDGSKVIRHDSSSVGILETVMDDDRRLSLLSILTLAEDGRVYKIIYPLEMPVDLDDDHQVSTVLDTFGRDFEPLTNLVLAETANTSHAEADQLIPARAAEINYIVMMNPSNSQLESLAMQIHEAISLDVLAQ